MTHILSLYDTHVLSLYDTHILSLYDTHILSLYDQPKRSPTRKTHSLPKEPLGSCYLSLKLGTAKLKHCQPSATIPKLCHRGPAKPEPLLPAGATGNGHCKKDVTKFMPCHPDSAKRKLRQGAAKFKTGTIKPKPRQGALMGSITCRQPGTEPESHQDAAKLMPCEPDIAKPCQGATKAQALPAKHR